MKAIWIRSECAVFDATQFAAFYIKQSILGGKYWYVWGGLTSGLEIRLDYAEDEEDVSTRLEAIHRQLTGNAKKPKRIITTYEQSTATKGE